MEISKQWLEKKKACPEGIIWFSKQEETEGLKVVKKLIEERQLNWANWLIVRVMADNEINGYKMCVSYAIFAAEQIIDIHEKKYPNSKRPRQAIEAARRCVDNPSEENKSAAAAYAAAAYAADTDTMKLKILN